MTRAASVSTMSGWKPYVDALADALHDYQYGDNGTSFTRDESEALAVVALDHLRDLPVEERMEAMGMVEREYFCNTVWAEPTRGARASSECPDPTGQPGTTEPTPVSRSDVSRGRGADQSQSLGPETSA